MWRRCEFSRLHTQSQAMLMTKGSQPRACPFKPCVMQEPGVDWTEVDLLYLLEEG